MPQESPRTALFEARDPNYRARVQRIFAAANFVQDVGIVLDDFGPGWCETSLTLAERHLQQDGVVHAGVHALIADHSAGAAAGSLVPAGQIVLSIEFKINMLRAARGAKLTCRAEVLRPGSNVSVAEASVFVQGADMQRPVLVSKAMVTIAVVPAPNA